MLPKSALVTVRVTTVILITWYLVHVTQQVKKQLREAREAAQQPHERSNAGTGVTAVQEKGRGPRPPVYLYLTHWNYVLVCAGLLSAGVLPAATWRLVMTGLTVVSLFVLVARLAFLKFPRSPTAYKTAWDVLTHVVVPLLPVAVLALSKRDPCTPSTLVWTAAFAGVFVLLAWMGVNVAAQAACPRRTWVYGAAANPQTEDGRKQMVAATGLGIVCACVAAGAFYLNLRS